MAEQTTLLVPANAQLSWLRQVGVMVGIAAAVALGVAVVLWSRTPSYGMLYSSLSDRDLTQVMDALQAADIRYKVDNASGAIMVPADQVHDARLKLAAAGLPKSASMGFEVLDNESNPFGNSQTAELARFQRALEEELARSIGKLSNVRSARVHLAIPKPSVFARDKKDPSASVLLDLYPGRALEEGQVDAIAHMVSASVPNLKMSAVTVVDQQGRLLTGSDGPEQIREAAHRFQYTRKLEDTFARRVEDILTPLVGNDGVKASVAAEVDFTATEQTSESFNPDSQSVRSEQTLEENRAGSIEGGVPGALSNQPPGAGAAPETTAADPNATAATGATAAAAASTGPQSNRRQATRNFEVDRTISHSRLSAGSVRRLSVAVLVDNKTNVGKNGKITKTPFTKEEIDRMTALVKEAVGFDATRGDTVNVTNADFTMPPKVEPLPEPPAWKQAWVIDLGKQVLGGMFALIVAFGVIRPAIRSLMRREVVVPTSGEPMMNADGSLSLPGGAGASLPGGAGAVAQLAPPRDQSELDRVKMLASQDPKLAAQVVKGWVNAD
ncbi:MAG: flagellar basal-body MS-ring/collar protein FliF [Gammaproteobacteria bacterium]